MSLREVLSRWKDRQKTVQVEEHWYTLDYQHLFDLGSESLSEKSCVTNIPPFAKGG